MPNKRKRHGNCEYLKKILLGQEDQLMALLCGDSSACLQRRSLEANDYVQARQNLKASWPNAELLIDGQSTKIQEQYIVIQKVFRQLRNKLTGASVVMFPKQVNQDKVDGLMQHLTVFDESFYKPISKLKRLLDNIDALDALHEKIKVYKKKISDIYQKYEKRIEFYDVSQAANREKNALRSREIDLKQLIDRHSSRIGVLEGTGNTDALDAAESLKAYCISELNDVEIGIKEANVRYYENFCEFKKLDSLYKQEIRGIPGLLRSLQIKYIELINKVIVVEKDYRAKNSFYMQVIDLTKEQLVELGKDVQDDSSNNTVAAALH